MNNIHYVTSVLKQQMVFPTTILQTGWSVYIRVLRRFPGSVNRQQQSARSHHNSSCSQLLYALTETTASDRPSTHLAIRVLNDACAEIICDLSTQDVCGIHECFYAHIRGICKC